MLQNCYTYVVDVPLIYMHVNLGQIQNVDALFIMEWWEYVGENQLVKT